MKGLQKVFEIYKLPMKTWLTKADCIDLVIKHAKLLSQAQNQDIIMCYGMSKMLIIEETNPKHSYDKMNFVEFLEFLTRISLVVFKEES